MVVQFYGHSPPGRGSEAVNLDATGSNPVWPAFESKEECMGHTPKAKCPVCEKKQTLEWKGQGWVIPSHAKNGLSAECRGTGSKIKV